MAKRLGWTFLIGGALGMLAQLIYNVLSLIFTDPDFLLTETLASDTLVTMGIFGALIGGLGVYRHLDERSSFGSGLPFSGFAFGIGKKMIGPWTAPKEKRENFWKCSWRGLWLVIWFNVLVFAGTFIIAAIFYYVVGIHDSSQFMWVQPGESVTGPLLYFTAFITGGIIACFWEAILILTKIDFVWILASAWLFGALLTPTGIMGWLGSFGGWGSEVMIMNGGQILYNVAFMFFNGEALASWEFIVLVTTIGCLFLTGWLCFIIHILRFGHKPQNYSELTESDIEAQTSPQNTN